MMLYLTTAKVLRRLLDFPDRPRFGTDLIRETGIKSGSMFPILTRLEHAGFVTAQPEGADPHEVGRPSRTYYRLTPRGERYAREQLSALAAELAPPPVKPSQFARS